MIFKYVVKVGNAILLPFGELSWFIVKTKFRAVPDGGIPTWCWG